MLQLHRRGQCDRGLGGLALRVTHTVTVTQWAVVNMDNSIVQYKAKVRLRHNDEARHSDNRLTQRHYRQ